MRVAKRLRVVALTCGLLMMAGRAAADEPKAPVAKSVADRNAQKIPTKISGTYNGGELIELRVRDRIAYLVKPTARSTLPSVGCGSSRFGWGSTTGLAIYRTATT